MEIPMFSVLPPIFHHFSLDLCPGLHRARCFTHAGTAGTAVAFPAAKGADTAEARQAAKVSHEKREKQAAKVRRRLDRLVGSAAMARNTSDKMLPSGELT